MKNKFFLYMAAIGTALAMTACSPEDFDAPNEAGVPKAADYADNIQIDVDQSSNWVTFSLKNAKGVMPVWKFSDDKYSTVSGYKQYYRKKGEYSVDVYIQNANGKSKDFLTKTFQVDKTIMTGFGGFDSESEYNLWNKATIGDPAIWYAPGWAEIAPFAWSRSGGNYTATLPSATSDTWQAQFKLPTDITTEATKNYDFSVILTSTKDHPHVMVKLVKTGGGDNDNIFYFAETVSLKANEPVCFWKSDMPGLDAQLDMVFDFGGNEADTEISVENIVLKDHANDDGTVVPEVPVENAPTHYAPDADTNMFLNANYTIETWYNPGWGGEVAGGLPYEITDGEIRITVPTACDAQWQAQFKLHTDINISAEKEYDFYCEVESDNAISGATFKLVMPGGGDNDNVYILNADNVAIAGDGATTYVKFHNLPGIDIQNLDIVTDWGAGVPDNTHIILRKITVQEHME